jgi:hypothetical protein
LLDQEGGDVPELYVLNAEVPFVRHLDRIFRDLDRREYDYINRVLVTLPLSDL